jgi:hypothetical protein
MAAPMTPASPFKSNAILAKESAIQKRLDQINNASKDKATSQLAKDIEARRKAHKSGTVTRKFDTQYIKGANEGFSQTDFGALQGAAIPYQIGTKTNTVSEDATKFRTPRYGFNPLPNISGNVVSNPRLGAISRRAQLPTVTQRPTPGKVLPPITTY